MKKASCFLILILSLINSAGMTCASEVSHHAVGLKGRVTFRSRYPDLKVQTSYESDPALHVQLIGVTSYENRYEYHVEFIPFEPGLFDLRQYFSPLREECGDVDAISMVEVEKPISKSHQGVDT